MSFKSLGTVARVTYGCDVAATRGLCRQDPSTPYAHPGPDHPPWQHNPPELLKDEETGKFWLRGCVGFLDGPLHYGIDDAVGHLPKTCSVIIKTNPAQMDILGSLIMIETKDGKAWEFSGALLCIDKGDGPAGQKHLYIMDKKDAPKMGISANPQVALEALDHAPSAAEVFGPKLWSVLHGTAALYRGPEDRAHVEEVIKWALAVFPCRGCGEHGLEDLKANPLDFSSRESLARGIWSWHNRVRAFQKKEPWPWSDSLAPKEEGCSNGLCHVGTPVVRVYSNPFCSGCPPAIEALKASGLPYEVVDISTPDGAAKAAGIPRTPTLQLLRNGEVVKSHEGVMDTETLKEWIK